MIGEAQVKQSIVLLGLGNLLCSDDSLGVRVAQALGGDPGPCAPGGLEVLDGGTLGLSLLPRIESADLLLLVDAVHADLPAGTLLRMTGQAVWGAARKRLSAHQTGVADLLACAHLLGEGPTEIVLWGVVPASLELGAELSEPVNASFPALLRAVLAELGAHGIDKDALAHMAAHSQRWTGARAMVSGGESCA